MAALFQQGKFAFFCQIDITSQITMPHAQRVYRQLHNYFSQKPRSVTVYAIKCKITLVNFPLKILICKNITREAYRDLHLMCYNLYIVILFIVVSTYKLFVLCSFIYANILHSGEFT